LVLYWQFLLFEQVCGKYGKPYDRINQALELSTIKKLKGYSISLSEQPKQSKLHNNDVQMCNFNQLLKV
jgi:hypothetical protein